MSIRNTFALILLLAAIAPTSAFAQTDGDKATARELTLQGYAALDAKDYAKAADLFKRAESLYHAPTISLGLGRAYVGLGKLMSAQEALSRTAHETVPPNAPAPFTSAVADAQRELAAISPRVPGVVISVKGPAGAKVTLDGVEVPGAALGVKRPVDPGPHAVRVVAPGFLTSDVNVSVAEGKVESVTVELKVDPNPAAATAPPRPAGQASAAGPDQGGSSSSLQKTLGFVGIGVGGAGLVMGAVTGGLALAKHGDIAGSCADGVCPAKQKANLLPKIDSYKTLGTLSTAGFVAGGVLAVAGIVTLVTAPKSAQKAAVTPVIGLGYLGVDGRF